MKTKYTELSQKLDHIINFAVDDDPDDRRFPIKTTVGGAGVGAAGYGLYKRGQALGTSTGIGGNILAGAKAIPGDVRNIAGQAATRASLLAHPEAGKALLAAARKRAAGGLEGLARFIHP